MEWVRKALLIAAVAALAACASTTRPGAVGITREQLLLVSAADVERMSAVYYNEQNNKARAANKLITSGPEFERLRAISNRLIKQTGVFREDAAKWKWQLSLIDAPTLNASCAPGGKITFYTGIIRQLRLTDDEIAAIMGHEIAHALREHGREKVSESMGQEMLLNLALAVNRDLESQAKLAKEVANVVFTLPNSREKESEADRMGLELMARAGYNPEAAINVWRKMSAATKGQAPLEFLSTHPAHSTRINELTALQPVVRPFYERAPKP